MARKNRTTPDKRIWTAYLIIGVLLMAGVAFFSSWRAMRTAEERFCQTLEFVKSQSTSFEKHNDTITAKALRRTAVAVHQLAENPALDLSDPQCLNRQTEKLWLTGISVLGPDGTLRCESTTNGIGYDRFGDQLKNDAVLDVLSYPRKTYVKRVLLEDGSAVDVAAHRAESTELLLLAYRYTPAEFVEETALSIQSVLDGYPAETSGTLFIVQNNQVIAANSPELMGQDTADSPLVQGIRKAGAAEKLTHTRDWNGSGCYFGMFCHGRSFDLYAYTDEKIIFREALLLILTVLVGYILLVMILQLLRRRSVQEMELQKKEQERKYQTQLEEQNRKLEIALQHEGAANRAKREFLFNMSHDIRTPMNAIIGFTSLAATHIDNREQVLDYLKKISTSSQHLLSLINDVLDMSRIESGKVKIEEKAVHLPDLVHDVRSIIQPNVSAKRLSLFIDTMDVENEDIITDPLRLNQILLNILSNAIKFTQEGSIRFGYKLQDDKMLYFYVSDTGCGIPEGKQESIFGRFVKLNNFAQGTGLGLSICQMLVQHMGGNIGLTSKPGEGSTFWFTLPYVPASRIRQAESKTEPIKVKKQKITVLVAEDHDSNFRLIESILRKDYNLIHAWNGQEAVNMFREYDPQLILMDINMPVMNGYEATREIRKYSTQVPIIAVTAFAYASDEQQVMENGFDAYMAKPINANQLRTQISAILKQHIIFM